MKCTRCRDTGWVPTTVPRDGDVHETTKPCDCPAGVRERANILRPSRLFRPHGMKPRSVT